MAAAKSSSVRMKPLSDRVVVRPLEAKGERVSTSGIIIATDKKETPAEGKVVAVGPGRMTDEGKRVPMEVKIGDTVLFKKPWDEPVKIDGVAYYVLSESEITLIRN